MPIARIRIIGVLQDVFVRLPDERKVSGLNAQKRTTMMNAMKMPP